MKYKLFILTILASISFYNYHGMVSDQVAKAMFYLCFLASLIISLKDGLSLSKTPYPRTAYIVLLAGLLVAAVMGTVFHSQGLIVSLICILPYLFSYGYFYILMKFDLPREKIMNAMLVLCGIATIVYFCNLATAPHNIFGKPIIGEDLTRGIIRFPIPLLLFFPMIVFYGINKYLDTQDKKWLVVIGIAMLVIFLSAVRQLIGLTALLGLAFYFRRIELWKKILFAVIVLGIVVLVLPQIPIYKTMIELSEDQRDENDHTENIRITAWKFFTYENQTNAITPILGNGMPSYGASLWGKMFDTETEVTGCYPADVGWAGFYWHFGLITTAALLTIIIKALLRKKSASDQYLNYYLIYISVTSIASGPILYYNEILYLMLCLYMIYKPTLPDEKDDSITIATEYEDSRTNTKLQQLPRYPQLH